MKKILLVFSLMFSLFLFASCKGSKIEINNSELTGKGTLSDPYTLTLEFGENTSVAFDVTDDRTLSFEVGQKENGKFVKLEASEATVEVVKTATTNEFHVNSLNAGITLVRFYFDGHEVFLETTVNSLVDVDFSKDLKILAIGNSFSDDAMEYLYDIAENYGVENIVLGNLYIGGASLQVHYANSQSNNDSYAYRKNVNGVWETTNNSTLLDGITDEDWDIITLQQASGSSGLDSSYDPYLDLLIGFVNQNKTNPNAKLAWHMTWAYQQDSNHADFVNYDQNQMTMYNEIVRVVEEIILENEDISFVIPAGTTIQNLRTSFYGDTVTRDGFHLTYSAGRYAAGLIYFAAITGLSIDNLTFVPQNISEYSVSAIKEAVNAAIQKPLEISESTHTKVEERDDSFGKHYVLNYGNQANVVWNEEVGGWTLAKTPGLQSAAHYYLDEPTVGHSYEFSADILMHNTDAALGEFVIELLNENDDAIRVVLKLEHGRYVMFTDVRRQLNFSGYLKLFEFPTFDDYINVKIEKEGDQYKFYLNETLVYDRELEFGDTHVVIGAVQTEAIVKNIQSEVYNR